MCTILLYLLPLQKNKIKPIFNVHRNSENILCEICVRVHGGIYTSSLWFIFRKRALQLVVLLRKMTCNLRHPTHSHHLVPYHCNKRSKLKQHRYGAHKASEDILCEVCVRAPYCGTPKKRAQCRCTGRRVPQNIQESVRTWTLLLSKKKAQRRCKRHRFSDNILWIVCVHVP